MLQSRPIGDEDLKGTRPCQRLFIETGQLVQQSGRRRTSGRVKMTTPFPPISASSPNGGKKTAAVDTFTSGHHRRKSHSFNILFWRNFGQCNAFHHFRQVKVGRFDVSSHLIRFDTLCPFNFLRKMTDIFASIMKSDSKWLDLVASYHEFLVEKKLFFPKIKLVQDKPKRWRHWTSP